MKVRYGKSKTPIGFWCGRSHRCHGNPIFCGNFLVSALQVQFFSDRLQVWHGGVLWEDEAAYCFWCGRSHRCHGNDIFCKILVSDLPGVILLGSSSNLVWRCVMISRRRVLVFGVGGVIVAMVTPFLAEICL